MAGGSMNVVSSLGVRKAAVLLVQLGRDRAAQVLAHLPEADVEVVSAEIARLESLDRDEVNEVLSEFADIARAQAHLARGGLSVAEDILRQSLGNERATAMIERLTATNTPAPFAFLQRAEPAQLRSFIADEHPQTIALILAHMPPDRASMLLSGLAPEQQTEIAHRIATMERALPDLVHAVEATLERRLSSMLQPADVSQVGGLDPLVSIINRSDRATERQIVAGLEAIDAGLADELRSRMFLFEDVVLLDDRSMQLVLRQVALPDLAMALKGVGEAVRRKILDNLSSRAAENLAEEVELLGPVRLTQVEEAQQAIIRSIRRLEESGEIVVRRGGDDDFVE
ncbi:flagellar motor switch protein FliG [Aeromicrobium phragmitis]|uniref:Flagellar motor switch protein FliG n=2 Tax=Aeromicrobium phragmitis TaxID=2478914 RepID=A0A3L8PM58_9ACTN|nr:flagellar motor switch protein FliG [Aeromicrobium phragmitis]